MAPKRIPPYSSQREVIEGDDEDDWILATIEGWIRTSGRPQDDVVAKIMTSFSLEELRKSAVRLRAGKWATPQISVPDSGSVEYSSKLATVVYTGLLSIQNQATPAVLFWVSAEDLHKVPGAAILDRLDEAGVSVRLGGVDTKLNMLLERLVAAERLEETVRGLATIVIGLQEQLSQKDMQQQQQQAQQLQQSVAGGSYADRARGSLVRPEVQGLRGGERGRSPSIKRGREYTGGEGRRDPKLRRTGVEEDELDQARTRRERHPEESGSLLSEFERSKTD